MKNNVEGQVRQYTSVPSHPEGISLQQLLALVNPQPDWWVLDVTASGEHTALTFAGHPAYTPEGCQHSAERFPFPTATVDCITCRDAAHHFVDIGGFMQECVRVLRPGGLLAVADPVVSGEPKVARYINVLEKLRDPSHNWVYSVEDWDTFFFSAGLTATHRETFERELDFDEWATQAGVIGDDLTRLRVLILQAPEKPRDWLQPRRVGARLMFRCSRAILIGEKQTI